MTGWLLLVVVGDRVLLLECVCKGPWEKKNKFKDGTQDFHHQAYEKIKVVQKSQVRDSCRGVRNNMEVDPGEKSMLLEVSRGQRGRRQWNLLRRYLKCWGRNYIVSDQGLSR